MGRTSDARGRLLSAALKLVMARSYGAVTVDAICDEAGVKKGSFYHFFDSKSALAVAALQHDWDFRNGARWKAWFDSSIPPLQRIRNFLNGIYKQESEAVRGQGRVQGCLYFLVGSETCTIDQAINAKSRELLETQLGFLETAIREAQTLKELPEGNSCRVARSLFALFEGCVTQARIRNDLSMLEDLPFGALRLLGLNIDQESCSTLR